MGNIPVDLTPPQLIGLTVISNTQLDVQFDEPLETTSAQTQLNYLVNNGIGNPTTAMQDGTDQSLVHLTFTTPFGNAVNNTLTVTNIQDMAGNGITSANMDFMYFVSDTSLFRDVVINEIFADPSPQVGLPDAEYVELYNVSTTKIFDLNGWKLSDGGSPATLDTYILMPNQYVILCNKADTAMFNSYPNVLGVTSFPSLNNSGDPLDLKNNIDSLVDAVNYSSTWYNDAIKDDGGWSLEQINPQKICSDKNNWLASNNAIGGTPGQLNSINDLTPDNVPPQLIDISINSLVQIVATFSEKIDSISSLSAGFSINNGIGISAVSNIAPDYNSVLITFTGPIDTGVVYTLTVTNITDCEGNNLATGNRNFSLPFQGRVGDLIINELLFDPRTGGSDFVEVYNNSQRVISLNGWQLANYDNDTIDNFKSINDDFILYPEEYVVLTKDSANIKSEYPNAVSGRFIQMSSMPTYSNDSGTVYLVNNLNAVSDRMFYTDDMQFALLNSGDGVSLERLDFNRASNDITNWHSAAESVGFATPGFKNSQFFEGVISEGAINIEPEVFSPDNDGFEDVVNISYKFSEPGYVGNITIFDSYGRLVRLSMQNELLGNEGIISWDGINENNEKAKIGIYIIYFEVFNLSGDVQKFKRTTVLASKL